MDKALAIAVAAGVRYVYIGNAPGHRAENTYCHQCGKRLIERRGYVITNLEIINGKCAYCQVMIPGVWA